MVRGVTNDGRPGRVDIRRMIDAVLDEAGAPVPFSDVVGVIRESGTKVRAAHLSRFIGRSGWFQMSGGAVAFATRRFDIDPVLDPEMYVVIGGTLHGRWAWYPTGRLQAGHVPPSFVHALGVDPTGHQSVSVDRSEVRFRFCSDGSVRASRRASGGDSGAEWLDVDWSSMTRTRLVVAGPGRAILQGLFPVDDSSPAEAICSHLGLPSGCLPPLVAACAAMGLDPSTSSRAQLLASSRGRAEPFRTAVHRLVADRARG